MNNIQTTALLKAHPALLRSLRNYSFECNDGWFNLIAKLCADIEIQLQLEGVALVDYPAFLIIKEKFGTLRIQGGNYSAAIGALIQSVNLASETICELCGATGKLTRRRYGLSVLCAFHASTNPSIGIDVLPPPDFSSHSNTL